MRLPPTARSGVNMAEICTLSVTSSDTCSLATKRAASNWSPGWRSVAATLAPTSSRSVMAPGCRSRAGICSTETDALIVSAAAPLGTSWSTT